MKTTDEKKTTTATIVPPEFARFIQPTERAEIVTLTRPLVDWLLSCNTGNRGVRPAKVREYAASIRRGEWKVTSSGIGLTRDGVLSNGQHRLLAIRLCEYPEVRANFCYGLEPDIGTLEDLQSKRSAADLLAIAMHGSRAGADFTSALRIVFLLRRGDSNFNKAVRPQELAEAFYDYVDGQELPTFPWKQKGINSGFVAVCLLALKSGIAVADVQDFLDGFVMPVNRPEKDPVLWLNQQKGRSFGTGAEKVEWFGLVARVFLAAIGGERRSEYKPLAARDAFTALCNLRPLEPRAEATA